MGWQKLILCLFLGIEYWVWMWLFFPEMTDGGTGRKERFRLWLLTLSVAALLAYNGYYSLISTGLVIITPVIVLVLFGICYRKTVVEVWIWTFFYLVTGSLVKLCLMIGTGLAKGKNIIEINHGERTFPELLLEFITIACCIFLGRWMQKHKIRLRRVCSRYKRIFLFISIAEYQMMCYVMGNSMERMQFHSLVVDLCTLVSVAAVLLAVVVDSINRDIQEENKLIEIRNLESHNFYLELKKQYEENARTLHDVRHERAYLQKCLTEGEVEEARAYLEEKQRSTSFNQIWTGFKLVDFILNRKKAELDASGILFTFDCSFYQVPIPDGDFIVLLGNLFDNAVEAARKCDEGKRWIVLRLKDVQGSFNLEISNASTGYPLVVDGKFLTTKPDKRLHGWGMESIQMLVRKYDGTIKYYYTGCDFKVSIMFWKSYTDKEKRKSG